MLSAHSEKVVAAGTTCEIERLNKILVRNSEKARLIRELKSSSLTELESVPCAKIQQVPNSVFIPRLPSKASAMSTQWTRTNLFSNVKPWTEKYLYEHILESRNDYEISMTGRQLNMHDNDVYLHVIRLAQEQSAGQFIFFKRSEFLRALGKYDSDREYKDLLQSLKKLKSATIFIGKGKKGEGFNLIDDISWDNEHGYWFTLGSNLINQFKIAPKKGVTLNAKLNPKKPLAGAEIDGISFIDLNARLKIKKPMAKWLQNYMSGHKQGSHRITAQTLMRLSGSIGRLNDFVRRGLPGALEELKAVGLINSKKKKKNKEGVVVASWDRVAHPKSRTK